MNENLFSFSAISGQGEQPKFDSTAFDLGSDVNAPPPPAAAVSYTHLTLPTILLV